MLNTDTNTSPSFDEQERIAKLITKKMTEALFFGSCPKIAANRADPDMIISEQERKLIEDLCRKELAAREII